MHLVWAMPPAVLLAGAAALVVQVRRVGAEAHALSAAAERIEPARTALDGIAAAARAAGASMDELDHR